MKAQTVPDGRGLVPGIHVFASESKAWMAGTSPAMTIAVGPFNRDML
jgi:hypothetical protein